MQPLSVVLAAFGLVLTTFALAEAQRARQDVSRARVAARLRAARDSVLIAGHRGQIDPESKVYAVFMALLSMERYVHRFGAELIMICEILEQKEGTSSLTSDEEKQLESAVTDEGAVVLLAAMKEFRSSLWEIGRLNSRKFRKWARLRKHHDCDDPPREPEARTDLSHIPVSIVVSEAKKTSDVFSEYEPTTPSWRPRPEAIAGH